jgi:hypothetical protein
MLEEAFRALTDEGGRFHGLTKALGNTQLGKWSTLLDSAAEAAEKIGEALTPLAENLREMADGLIVTAASNPGLIRAAAGVLAIGAAAAGALPIVSQISEIMFSLGKSKGFERLAAAPAASLGMQSRQLFAGAGAGAAGAAGAGAARTGVLAWAKGLGTAVKGALTSPIGIAIQVVIAAVTGLVALLKSKDKSLSVFRDAANGGLTVLKSVALSLWPALKALGEALGDAIKAVAGLAGGLLALLLPVIGKLAQGLALVLIPTLHAVAAIIKTLVGLFIALGSTIGDMLAGRFTDLGRHWRKFAREFVDDWRTMGRETQKGWDVATRGPLALADAATAPAAAAATPTTATATTAAARTTITPVDIASLAALEAMLLSLQAKAREINGQLINLDPESAEAKTLNETLSETDRRMGQIQTRVDYLRGGMERVADATSAFVKNAAQGAATIGAQALQVGLARLKSALALGSVEAEGAALATRRAVAQLAHLKALTSAEATRDAALLAVAKQADLTDGQRGERLRTINDAHEQAAIALQSQLDRTNSLIDIDEARLSHAQRLRDLARETARSVAESAMGLVSTLRELARGSRGTARATDLLGGKEGISAYERERQAAALATDAKINAYERARAAERQAIEEQGITELDALRRGKGTTPEALQLADLARRRKLLEYDEATKDAVDAIKDAHERAIAPIERQERAAKSLLESQRALLDLDIQRGRHAADLGTKIARTAKNWWAEIIGGSYKELADAQNALADSQIKGLRAVQDAGREAWRGIQDAQRDGNLALSPEALKRLEGLLGRPFRGAEDIKALEGIMQSAPDALKPFLAKVLAAYEDAKYGIQSDWIDIKLRIDKASFDAFKKSAMEVANSALYNPVYAKGLEAGLNRQQQFTPPSIGMPGLTPIALGPAYGPIAMPTQPQPQRGRSEMTIRLDKGLIADIKSSVSDDIALVIQQEMR